MIRLPYPPSLNQQDKNMSARAKPIKWTDEMVAFLCENYPLHGKDWCANSMGLKEHQIRSKASALRLVARGVSEAWRKKQVDHAEKLTGRKRPEQASVMRKAIIDKGLHIHSAETNKKIGEQTSAWIKDHGHPMGMLGKKHTDAAKVQMSESGVARAKNEKIEVSSERILKGLKTKSARGVLHRVRTGTTWKDGWREVGGQRCYFRSKWEANYARYLQLLVERGEIARWEHEPETFWFEKIMRGVRSYLPDFRVTNNDGSVVYHEVKGWMDDRSKTKIKRMAKYHPQVTLIVIDSKQYKEITKKIAWAIKGWEQ